MSHVFRRILAVAALIAATVATPALAGTNGSLTIAPVRFPQPKQGGRELTFAFGKQAEVAASVEVVRDFDSLHVFDTILPEGGDFTFALSLDKATRTFDDKVDLSGKGTLTFKATGHFALSRGGAVVKEGDLSLDHVRTVDHQPWKSDLADGWREILLTAVRDSAAEVIAAGIVEPAAKK
jgi:hypothetical protein